jgi:pSer/pThr/pTyr-binding forkhead associated (FHA) protein
LRVVDLKSRNGTYLEGRRKKSFYLEPGQPFVVGARSHRLLALNDEMHAHYRDRELLAVTKQNEILQRKLRVADALIALQKNYRERRSIFRDGLACRPETPVVG